MKIFLSFILSFAILINVVGCTKTGGLAKEQVIRIALSEEPPDLNSMRSTDQSSFFVLGHTGEGLTRYDKDGKIAPGVAEKWEIRTDGATFNLRKNAKWSDGKPVTAHDFVFSWRSVVDPKTASQYAFIVYPVKNAEKINTGKAKPEELGVKAVDDYTLEVKFEKPCAYFLALMTFATYYPVREDFFVAQKGRYAADAKNLLANGPFVLTEWKHGASLKMEKNKLYWNAKEVTIQAIEAPYVISDPRARFNLFRDKKIYMTGLDSETMEEAEKAKLKIKRFSDGSVFYIEYNHRKGRLTSNINLRKAIQTAYNAKELVDKVISIPGNLPAYTLFPKWLKGVEKRFRQEYPVQPRKVEIDKAKEYLAKAKKELGITNKEFPELTILSGDSPNAAKQAEYLQDYFKRHLGIKFNLDKQIFKQRLRKMTTGDFDLVLAGWGPDYDDILTFGDLFTSWNENNRGKYSNSVYDDLVRAAQNSLDPKVRMDAMGKAQQILIEDAAILPMYERGTVYVQSPKLEGVVRSVVGADPNYIYAKIIN